MRIRSVLAFAIAFLLSGGMAAGAVAQASPRPVKPGRPAPASRKWVADMPLAAGTAAGTGGTLQYHGGPIMTNPRVYLVLWGNWSISPGADPNHEREYLVNFLSVVGATPWLDTVLQYTGSLGSQANLLAGEWNDSSTVPTDPQHPGTIPDQTQVQNEVYKAARYFGIPATDTTQNHPVLHNIVLVVTPQANVPWNSGCGYHNTTPWSAAEPYILPFIYEPYARCSAGQVFPSTKVPDDYKGDNDGVSIGVGHELAEAITDPVPSSGWIGPSPEPGGSEIGDECEQSSYNSTDQATMGRGNGIGTDIFAVQPLWSNQASACVLNYGYWYPWSGTLGAPSSGLPLDATPAVSSWAPGRLDVFTVDTNGVLEHKWFNGTNWNAGWETLGEPPGGALIGNVAAVSWGPYRIDVFGLAANGDIVHQWWDGTSWSGWKDEIGHPAGLTVGPPSVASWGPGRLDVFTRGSNGAVYHAWYAGGAWHYWESLGGNIIGAPAAVSWGPNRIDLFAVGTNGMVWHKWWNGTAWVNWASEIGAPPAGAGLSPAVSSWGPGRLDVFTVDATDTAVWHDWYAGGAWHSWQSLGGSIASGPVAASWLPNRVDVFGVGYNGVVYWKRYG